MFDHFGLLAPVYDRVFHFSHLDKLVKVASLPVDGILLDACGGTGRISISLKPYAHIVYVTDFSRKMLLQAHFKGLNSIQTPVELLPFPTECFDRIFLIDALHHVNNQQQTITELWRVLKVGGCLVIEEPDVRTFKVKILALIEKIFLMRSFFLTPDQINDLFPKGSRIEFDTDGFNAWLIIWK